jgi:type 1 glutamine amidotransferase
VNQLLRSLATVAAALLLLGCRDVPTGGGRGPAFRVLLFSRHLGYAHQSIPAAITALQGVGGSHGFAVEATEDAGRFTDEQLQQYRVVVFLSTTGDVLNDLQQDAFTRYIRAGGGFVGVHSASDTEYDWEWYHRLLGVYFAAHPPIQRARLQVNDRSHPSSSALPETWVRIDEWYDYRSPPPPGARILVSVDESSYSGGQMGAAHPVSWAQEFEGGRSWYTAMGHTSSSFAEPAFLEHLAGGVIWAAGAGQVVDLFTPSRGTRTMRALPFAATPSAKSTTP